MLNPLENYFLKQPEPQQSCMLYLRTHLIEHGFDEQYKYMTAMYYFKSKPFCYLSYSSKSNKLYVGFIKGYKMKHPSLKQEGRKQIKVLYLDPEKDLPLKQIKEIITEAKKLY